MTKHMQIMSHVVFTVLQMSQAASGKTQALEKLPASFLEIVLKFFFY